MQNVEVQREMHKFGGDKWGGFHLHRLLHQKVPKTAVFCAAGKKRKP